MGLKVLPVMMKETCRKAGYDLCLYKVYSREECTWKVYSYENESVENVSKKCILRRYVPWKCFSINMHGRWERTAIYLLHMFESCTLHFKSLPHSHYHQITLKRLKSQEVSCVKKSLYIYTWNSTCLIFSPQPLLPLTSTNIWNRKTGRENATSQSR